MEKKEKEKARQSLFFIFCKMELEHENKRIPWVDGIAEDCQQIWRIAQSLQKHEEHKLSNLHIKKSDYISICVNTPSDTIEI